MRSTRGSAFLSLSLLLSLPPALTGCVEPPQPAEAHAEVSEPAQASKTPASAPSPAPRSQIQTKLVDAPSGAPAPAPDPSGPLTEEELRLINADIDTLSPAEKRARAFAQRKKIMQDPNSEAAKSLMELQDAVRRGDVQPEVVKTSGPERDANGGLILQAPSAKPSQPAPADP